MTTLEDWSWAKRPETIAKFEAMMVSMDAHLAGHDVLPPQRPLTAQRLVALALNIGFSIPLPPRKNASAFDSADIPHWTHDWFKAVYGKRIAGNFEARSIVLVIRGTLWKARLPVVYGTMQCFFDPNLENKGVRMALNGPASVNGLTLIDDFTQALAGRLSNDEINNISDKMVAGFHGIEALNSFWNGNLFEQAKLDYEHSVDALNSGFAWNKARWETAQAAEKVIKGMLKSVNQPVPTQGRDAHDIKHLGGLVGRHFNITLPQGLLEAIDCKPGVRYGEIEATKSEALAAHSALLEILPMLATAHKAFHASNGTPP
ncbi:MAG: hypothetical protein JSS25_00180 [Proteobacteria bacterium]|nr:hypothetical protein [Pseudomonadota bacterium]